MSDKQNVRSEERILSTTRNIQNLTETLREWGGESKMAMVTLPVVIDKSVNLFGFIVNIDWKRDRDLS